MSASNDYLTGFNFQYGFLRYIRFDINMVNMAKFRQPSARISGTDKEPELLIKSFDNAVSPMKTDPKNPRYNDH